MPSRGRTGVTSGGSRLLLGALCAGIALAGCGGSYSRSTSASSSGSPSQTPSTPSTTPKSSTTTTGTSSTKTTASEPLPTAAIAVSIPGLPPDYLLPTRYTCDGQDISPPVRWTGVPHDTAELAIFAINFQPQHGRLFFDWAVAGLSPKLRGLAAGRLPPRIVTGRNSFGQDDFSICPPRGRRESYAVKVIALPHKIPAQPGFDALTLYLDADRSAKVVGFAGVAYKRP
jgi:phosphatidylethanolamine-binding protein (PEBP) family uncharacterized protein